MMAARMRRPRLEPKPLALEPAEPSGRPLTVTELSGRITRLLEEKIGHAHVEGEISNLRIPRSGHAYFALKDSESVLNAVCFRSTLARLKTGLEDGKKVEVRGRVTAYSARSQYQIIVSSVREAGLGELMRRFIELRDRLKAEGLFDEARKQPLPKLPRRIGVATSPTGAAVRDILNVLGRRAGGLEVFVAPCAVQGEAAPAEIARAIELLDRDGRAEVIIVGRGGGSIEDLWAFNEERVARAIAACKTPIVSAVGHETDTTLADYAADLRAPTPSAAAELVTAHYDEFGQKVAAAATGLHRAIARRVERLRARLEAAQGGWGMRRPIERLRNAQQRADDLDERLDRAARTALRRAGDRTRETARRLDRAHPGRRIELSITRLAHLRARMAGARPDRRWGPRIGLGRAMAAQLDRRLSRAMGAGLNESRLRLLGLTEQIEGLGPASVLRRGFSFITRKGGRKIVTGPGQARPGETLKVHSAGGEWKATALPEGEELFDDL